MKKRVFIAVLAVIILFCSVPSYAQEEALVKVKPIIQAQRGGMMIEGSLSYPYPKYISLLPFLSIVVTLRFNVI